VAVLGRRQTREQIAHRIVVRGLSGLAVEARGLEFHLFGKFAHRVEAERAVEPDWTPRHEALHVLAPDQRKKIAELLPVEIEQHVVMPDLFLRHPVVNGRGLRIRGAQPVGEGPVDPVVLLLVGNGEGQDFLFVQIGKALGSHRLTRIGDEIKRLEQF
jgi:hypothetical protein